MTSDTDFLFILTTYAFALPLFGQMQKLLIKKKW